MLRLIPPAGAPIPLKQLLLSVMRLSGNAKEVFHEKIYNLTGIKYHYFVNSGRSALLIGLGALSKIRNDKKDEVIIPAYTCYSVASSVARAGLKIRLVDINPETLDFDYNILQQEDFSRVLAIVGCNLLGISSDWAKLRELARIHNIFLIDDAAQSMGNTVDGVPSGARGDLGLFSLGRGKNLTTYSGGILLTDNHNLAAHIENALKINNDPGFIADLSFLIKTGLYGIFLRPRFYWLPDMMPFLKLGETIYDENFEVGLLSKLQISAGAIFIQNLAEYNSQRLKNAAKLIDKIKDMDDYTIPGYDNKTVTAYLRLPLLCPNSRARNILIKKFRNIAVVSTNLYPSTIRQIRGVEGRLACTSTDYPGAREVVERLLTLPTHPYLTQKDIERMTACLRRGV